MAEATSPLTRSTAAMPGPLMVVHPDHGPMVFVDAMPSEVIAGKADTDVITVAGVVCDEPDGMLPIGRFEWGFDEAGM